MQEDKVEIPGEEDAQETIIDLDATTPEQSLEEDIIDVEEISEDDAKSQNTTTESNEQQIKKSSESIPKALKKE